MLLCHYIVVSSLVFCLFFFSLHMYSIVVAWLCLVSFFTLVESRVLPPVFILFGECGLIGLAIFLLSGPDQWTFNVFLSYLPLISIGWNY